MECFKKFRVGYHLSRPLVTGGAFVLSIIMTAWWAIAFLPNSFRTKNWSPVGDTCVGCLRKGDDDFVLLNLFLTAFVEANLRLQNWIARSQDGYTAVNTHDALPGSAVRATPLLDKALDFVVQPRFHVWRVRVLKLLRGIHWLYWALMLTFLLRLQNLLWLRPCPYSMHSFSAAQQKSIGHDPASIFVVFHAEGYPDELRNDLLESKREYAARHGYSFVTTKDLFGDWDYSTWTDKLPLMQRNTTFDVHQRSRVWGKTLAIHHVLFESALEPKPQWVMWFDADAIIMRPELSAESLFLGMCARVDSKGELSDSRSSRLLCKHSPDWSANIHRRAMKSILEGKPSPNLLDDTPDLVGVNVNSGAGNNFNSGMMLVKNTEWVRRQLQQVWLSALEPHFDQKSYGVFFDPVKYPARVKVLPGCMGANGYTANWRAGRWMWGDFVAHTIGYDIPVNKLHAARGLQAVADGKRHPLLLPPWIYTA